jgi:hypothetical protein
MNRKFLVTGFAMLAITVAASAQEKAASAPSQDEMMKKWAEMASPGANHKAMEKFVGNWTYTNKLWMDPAAPPSESNGKASISMIMGGRYLQQNYTGDFMGMPFEGFGLMGFDNGKQEYVNIWSDNTSTSIMMMNGKNAKEDIVLTGMMDDAVTGKKMKLREVIRWTGPDSWVLEMYDQGEGGKEVKMMEITHTRVAG